MSHTQTPRSNTAAMSLATLLLMTLLLAVTLLAAIAPQECTASSAYADHARYSNKIVFQDHVVDTAQEDSEDISQIGREDARLSQFYVHMRKKPRTKRGKPANVMRILKEQFGSVSKPHYIPHNTYIIVAPRNAVARGVEKLSDKYGLWVREVDHEDKVCPTLKKLMKRDEKLRDGVLSEEDQALDDSFMNEGNMIGVDVLLVDNAVSDVRELSRRWKQQIIREKNIDAHVGPVSRRRLHVSVSNHRDAMNVLEWLGDQHLAAHIQHREKFESLDDMNLEMENNDILAMNDLQYQESDEQQVQSDKFDALLSNIDPLSKEYAEVLMNAADTFTDKEIGQPSMPDVKYLWSKGLTGEGEVVGIGDTGIDYNNCFFHDPKRSVPFNKIDMSHRKIVGYYTHADNKDYVDGHGTHVAGIVVGDSPNLPQFNGVQSKAKVVFIDIGLPDKRLSMPSDLTEDYFPLMYNVTPIASNSWGNKRFGQYTLAAREIDQFSWEHDDFLALFAAGNSGRSGSGTLTPPGTAKNCLTVGSSQSSTQGFRFGYPLYAELLKDQVADQICDKNSHFYSSEGFCQTLGKQAPCHEESRNLCSRIKRATDCCSNIFLRRLCCSSFFEKQVKSNPEFFSTDNMATFSSRGPTNDKRLKPDVVIPGQPIFSARSDGTSAKKHSSVPLVMQGTSMSTPIVAGYALMARQYFKKGFYPTGKPNNKDGFNPTGALLKAVVINSAVSLTGMVDWNGREDWRNLSPAPSFVQGFGRVSMSNVLKFAGESSFDFFKEETRLSTGETAEMCFRFPQSSKGDIKTRAPAFRTTLVWMDYPASPNAAITLVNNLDLLVLDDKNGKVYLGNGRRDFVNNVEQVTMDKADKTTLRVVVHGTNVPHGPQKFALVATCVGCERVRCKGKVDVERIVEERADEVMEDEKHNRVLLDLLTDPKFDVEFDMEE